jgi:hypothetical protein
MSYRAWSVVYGEQPSASKWNILGTNDDHFYSFLGSSNSVQSYTPTITGLTGANNTVVGRYFRVGNVYHVAVKITLGTGFGFSGSVSFTVPVTAKPSYAAENRGGSFYTEIYDVGTNEYLGAGRFETTNRVLPLVHTVNGTYSGIAGLGTGIPHAWAVGDYFTCQILYEGVDV